MMLIIHVPLTILMIIPIAPMIAAIDVITPKAIPINIQYFSIHSITCKNVDTNRKKNPVQRELLIGNHLHVYTLNMSLLDHAAI